MGESDDWWLWEDGDEAVSVQAGVSVDLGFLSYCAEMGKKGIFSVSKNVVKKQLSLIMTKIDFRCQFVNDENKRMFK